MLSTSAGGILLNSVLCHCLFCVWIIWNESSKKEDEPAQKILTQGRVKHQSIEKFNQYIEIKWGLHCLSPIKNIMEYIIPLYIYSL